MDYGSGGRLCTDEMSSRGVWDDSIMESRFCGQVENGTPSTSPPYWDTDDDDDGPKPSALYGKFTWKIEKFSQINKRELRSNAFEVGGYKWYILIYPQGCDVCNHLSLFLCVANHDKLLPGWSHFAQFTIAVVNKDPKKSKYSDTLHRFCKKEHDWGWKKFIEISKVFDGFVNDDSLVIKAQVQVIREKANHPFRCLDCQYRRELVRVYLSNVEQICRRFIEDRKGKLCKLIDDKMRWSSFRAFWLGMDEKTKEQMSREKTDNILKVVVKNFFVEKEVTSTLVMDSLYSGLKALESQSRSKIKKGKMKLVEGEEKLPVPVVYSENNQFVLSDDVLQLVERAALGPIPLQPLTSKNEKGSLNITKDAHSGEDFNKDVIERDERRLTEFGLRTLEYYILFHIFSRIDVAHKEAVALKRQEELIREEEAAELAEIELKARRSAAEKEKRAKKKQAKQKRNGRKIKDKTKDEIVNIILQDKHQVQSSPDEYLYEELSTNQEEHINENNCIEQNASETSDTADDLAEITQPDVEEHSANSVANALEINTGVDANNIPVQHEQADKCTAVMDDSSSTCSSETIPSVVINGSHKGNSVKMSRSQYRGKNQMNKETCTKASDDRGTKPESRPGPVTVNLLIDERKVRVEQISKEEPTSVPKQPPRAEVTKPDVKPSFTSRTDTHSPKQTQNHSSENVPAPTLKKTPTKSPSESAHPKETISRPYSAPLIPPQKPATISVTPQPSSSSSSLSSSLSRSISAAGRLGADLYPSPPFIPHSYRNAITGRNDTSTTQPVTFTYPYQSLTGPGLTFGSVNPTVRHLQLRDEHDEFPHMDIIYDLLDEDRVAVTETGYHSNGYGYQHYYDPWPPYGLPYDHDDGRYGHNGYAYNAQPGNTWPQNGL